MLISDYYDKTKVSLYQPSSDVIQLSQIAKENYQRGYEIINQAYPELNDRSVKDDEQNGKKIFNAYVDESSLDPFEAWKWKGTRSAGRNAAIAMHAQLTSGFLFPAVSAQDENDMEDRAVGDFMRELLIWMGENSNYKTSFIQAVMGMLTNPVTYLGAEYAEVLQKVREKTDSGYEIKEVLDEELSGFRAPVYSSSDILITNAYVQNIQQQTCVIKQRYLDYSDAQKKYGKHENWQYVQKGVNSIFNDSDGLFYDVRDPENPDLVKETILMWRSEDLEIPFLGGVYMGEENTEHNPMTHRDVRNNPKYDVVPFGYYRISEHFFYYKSLMSSLQWDDALLDEMYRSVMNREFLDLIPPVVITGEEKVDTSVVFPGAQLVTANKDTKVSTLLPPSQGNRYAALATIEKSIREGSVSEVSMGQLPQEASQKATAIVQATQSAKTLLKGVGRTLGESLIQFGQLMVNIAVRYLSIPQVQEITGGGFKTRYAQFVLPNQSSKGKTIGKVLKFDGELVGKMMTEKEKDMENVKLAEKAGENSSIMVMNPEMAARMKYLISFDPEEMFVNNQQQMQLILQNLYAQLRQDPLIDSEVLVREYMYAFFKSKGDDFINKNPIQPVEGATGEQKMPTPVASPVGGMV